MPFLRRLSFKWQLIISMLILVSKITVRVTVVFMWVPSLGDTFAHCFVSYVFFCRVMKMKMIMLMHRMATMTVQIKRTK